jgi:putative spermidine/putrescine transport system permease protein
VNDNETRHVKLTIYGLVLGVFLVAPLIIIIPLSFTGRQSFAFPPTEWSLRWYERFFSNPAWFDSLVDSTVLALVVMVVAGSLGTLAALGLDRSTSRWAGILNDALLAPRIVPVVVLAIGVFSLFLRWHLSGTLAGFVLAHTVLAIPVVIIPVSARLKSLDRRLESAAAGLGASPVATLGLITIPLIAPGVVTGMVFAFITSFDETVISLFLSSPRFKTLPVKMYESVTVEVDPTIAAASTIILCVTLALVLFIQLAQTRRNKNDL